MKTISVILPCYNEEESLPLYFKAVDPVIEKIEGYQFDFVLVNDGSKDHTLDVMKDLYQKRNDVIVVNEARNFGQNAALTAGLLTAKGDYVVMMDVDLQDPVELLAEICKKFDEGFEVVNPHRANRQSDSKFKRTTAGMFYKFINKLEGKKVIPENVNCFRGLSRRAVDALNALPEKDRYYVALVPMVGFETCEIDFVRQERDAGESKYNVSKMFDYAFNLISCTTAKPLYAPLKAGAISMAITGFLSVVFLVLFFLAEFALISHETIYLVFLLIFALAFFASLIIFVIGIIGLYMHNILINTRERPTTQIGEVLRPEEKEKTE